ncbi:peptide ABC transporter substrate-binding protein [Microbulbifer guangxiensis]|uniref:peptide ABC transporter substrate-binding protein n=1 Tax=Microbulbifer guangxiensis TaxID=2904249 RepID=UPI001F2F50FA|nr:peptide ABC transporter substrate-binding protein [Microbulbifer guangxiensis]
MKLIKTRRLTEQSLTVVLLATGAIFLAACGDAVNGRGKQDSNIPGPDSISNSRTLVRGNSASPTSLDPQHPGGLPQQLVIRDLFEGLTVPAQDGGVIPGVAARWESKDGLVYRFHLREDARWSNGDPVTAHDFVFSWGRLAAADRDHPESSLSRILPVKNAREIEAGELPLDRLGIQAINDLTLEVELSEPLYNFVRATSWTSLVPVHRPSIARHGKAWAKPGNLISNGAFTLSKWVVNGRIEAERNAEYWDHDNVQLDRVVYLPVTSRKQELDRFRTGELHITYGVAPEGVPELEQQFPQAMQEILVDGIVGLSVNTTKPPLDDPRVRRALAYALDREVMATGVAGRPSRPAYSYGIGVVPLGSNQEAQWHLLPEQEREQWAKELYGQAGYSKSYPLKISILFSASDENKNIAMAAAAMWKKVLGAEINLDGVEWQVRNQRLLAGQFDVAIFKQQQGPEPANQYQQLSERGFQNFGDFRHAEYEALAAMTTSTLDAGARQAIYSQLEAILAEQMPFIPIYQMGQYRLVSPEIQGYETTQLTIPASKFLSFGK